MKILTAFLCALIGALLCEAPLRAQPSPGPSSPAGTDKTELMLQRLRDALTNPPVASPETRPSQAAPPPSVGPTVSAPEKVPSSASSSPPPTNTPVVTPGRRVIPIDVRPGTPGQTVAPSATPTVTATEGLGPNPPPTNRIVAGPMLTRTNTAAQSARTNVAFPGFPQAAATPSGRSLPPRTPTTIPGPQPGLNPPGGAVPAGAVGLPGTPVPTAVPSGTNVAVTVSTNLNPNELISAGTIQLQGMDPDQFFDIYTMVSGRTVIRNWQLQGLQKITLKAATDWTRQEAVYAMDAVLAQNQIAMIPIGDKFVKAVPMQFAPTEGAPMSKVTASDTAEDEQFITQVVKLENIKPTDLQQLLATFTKSPQGITPFDSTQTLVIRDYASNVKRMLEVIRNVDIAPKEPDYHVEAIPVKYGKVIDLYTTIQALISGSAGAAGAGTAAAGSQFGQYGGQRGRFGGGSRVGSYGGGGYGGGYGGGGYGGGYGNYGSSYNRYGGGGGMYPYEESVERLTPQQITTTQPTPATGTRTSVGGAQNTFNNRMNQILRKAAGGTDEVQVLEDARIVPDERSNKLLVFANKRDMEMITNIVNKVDELLAQVLIEAIIMEVRLGDSQKLGISWAQRPRNFGEGITGAGAVNNGQSFLSGITNFPGAVGQGFTYFGAINNQWDIAINALAENSSINVISRPRIQTSHAIPGSFFVGETVPYITGFTDYGGYVGTGGLATRSVVQQANVGFSLFVTPFITPNGLVVMEISQEFSTRGRDVLIDNNPVPIINGRNADSTLTIRDGDTIMMGGFITENQSRAKSGVPFLKDIPGVGALFRSKNNSNDRTELIVLMRARVLRSPEDAAIVAAQEKSELPGIYQAEDDLRKANDKRRQKAQKSRENRK